MLNLAFLNWACNLTHAVYPENGRHPTYPVIGVLQIGLVGVRLGLGWGRVDLCWLTRLSGVESARGD